MRESFKQEYPDWLGIYSKTQEEKDKPLKIYLSIDNESLHFFANKLLELSFKYGYDDFDFKINNDERENRRDNIVIYCHEENFARYIDLVKEIIETYPKIKFNEGHLLAIPLDDKISYAVEPKDKETSYTDFFCQKIFSALRKNVPIEDIVNELEIFQRKTSLSISTLYEETKNKKRK